jgi:hypothetical protein|tara:strand:- start:349 stop:633 length:285 start_codon:yes stop_codon:yes gene_type:complete
MWRKRQKPPKEVEKEIEQVAKVVREVIEGLSPDWEILQLLVHSRSERVVLNQEQLAKHYERRIRAKLGMLYRQGRWNGKRPIVVKPVKRLWEEE